MYYSDPSHRLHASEKQLYDLAEKYKWERSEPSVWQRMVAAMQVRAEQAFEVDMNIFKRTVVSIKNNPSGINYGPTASWVHFYLYNARTQDWHSKVRDYDDVESALGFWCNRIISLEFPNLPDHLRQKAFRSNFTKGYDRFLFLLNDPESRSYCDGINAINIIIQRFIENSKNVPNPQFYVWNVGGSTQYNLTCVRGKS